MVSTIAEDRQRVAFSWMMSLGITGMLLLMFVFIKLTRITPPVAPMELFLEVNYGVDKVGSGNIQTFNKANDSKVAENMRSGDESTTKKVVTPPKQTPPAPQPVKTTTKAKAPERVITSKAEESTVKEVERTETKKAPAASTKPPVEAAPAKVEPKINNDALFKKSSGSNTGSNGTNGTKEGIGGNNNGDDASGVGDKGVKEGSLYAKNYQGSGGGGGSNVGYSLAGWRWKRAPVVNDKSDATGQIVFKIIVDSNGRVKNVITQSTTVTDYAVVNKYKDAVRALTFERSTSASAPSESTGTITFKISSK